MTSPVAPEPGLTTGEWLHRWLASRVSLRASTRRSYAAHVRGYLVPYLGGIPLAALSAGDVQAMFTAIARDETALGRPVTAATLHRIHARLWAALNGSPDGGVLRQVRGHRLYALFHLVALRGLRRGEAAGLRWSDLDLEAATLTVSGQLQQLGGRLAAAPPKSDAGRRVIALDKSTVVALREHRARQLVDRDAAGARWAETGYVFATVTGKPVGPDRLTRLFRTLVTASGLPPVHPARAAARRRHARPGGRGRPEGGPGPARPLQHRLDCRYLHQRPAGDGAHGCGAHRRAAVPRPPRPGRAR
jgi:integrase